MRLAGRDTIPPLLTIVNTHYPSFPDSWSSNYGRSIIGVLTLEPLFSGKSNAGVSWRHCWHICTRNLQAEICCGRLGGLCLCVHHKSVGTKHAKLRWNSKTQASAIQCFSILITANYDLFSLTNCQLGLEVHEHCLHSWSVAVWSGVDVNAFLIYLIC